MSEVAAGLGARCDLCVLRGKGTHVPSRKLEGAELDVVTDYPRKAPEGHLVGAAVMSLSEAAGGARLNVLSAVGCAPPKGHLEDVLAELSQENRRLVMAGAKPRPGPVECCRPRLLAELGDRPVLTLGPEAFEGVTGRQVEVMKVRGTPVELVVDGRSMRVLPTVHAMQKQPVWRRVFRADVQKALRWARVGLVWPRARQSVNPTPEALEAFLAGPGPFAVDVETTREDPRSSRLKCVGLATTTEAVLVQVLSVEGPGGRLVDAGYSEADRARVNELLRAFFADPDKTKVGHNAVFFDAVVLARHFGVEPRFLDTMLVHRLVDPEAPHNLGFVGSMFTDAPSWKAEHEAAVSTTDKELAEYCMQDCLVTVRALAGLEAQAAGLLPVLDHDHQVQVAYRKMRGLGVPVAGLEEEVKRLEGANRTLEWEVKKRGVDPGSAAQVRRLLFDEWQLAPRRTTSGGLPSVDVAALRLLRRGLDGARAETMDLLLSRARIRASWRALSEVRVEDGRVRPDWSVRADAWTPELERFVEAPAGKVLVSGRLLQPRLRLAAAEGGLGLYVEAFRTGADPHILTAEAMLGPSVRAMTGDGRQKVRRLAYDVLEALLYGAADEQVFEEVTLLEEADGRLRYPSLTQREVATMRRGWLKVVPEAEAWWSRMRGETADPVLGRRLLDVTGPEVLRWRIEEGAKALVQRAMLAAGYMHFIAHAGDTLVAEEDVEVAPRAEAELREALTGEVLGLPLRAVVSAGPRWAKVA